MVTYRCAACGATETAVAVDRLDAFWITVPGEPGTAREPVRYCGSGCRQEAEVKRNAGAGPGDAREEGVAAGVDTTGLPRESS